jgi:hypothetical protein
MEGDGAGGGRIQKKNKKSSICIRKYKRIKIIIKLKTLEQICKKELF